MYVIEGTNVVYRDERAMYVAGPVNKIETIRIDDQTLADVTFEFDLELGQYVELARVTYSNPNAVPPKDAKLAEISAACNAAILAGFTSDALGSPHSYEFGTDDQINLGGMLNAITAGIVTGSIVWKASGVPKSHTVEQFKGVFAAGLQHKNNCIARLWALKSQVLAAGTSEEIEAIVW